MSDAKERNHTIDFVELYSTDLSKTKSFYGAVFGWTFKDYGPDYMDIQGAGLSGGFARVDKAPTPGGALVVLYATDLEATLARVREAGGRISKEIFSFPGGRRFHFVDPTGNELAVWSDR
jgi:hypothetical protein